MAAVLRSLDSSAGEWPREVAQKMAEVGVRCAAPDPAARPHLGSEVKPLLDSLREASEKEGGTHGDTLGGHKGRGEHVVEGSGANGGGGQSTPRTVSGA